MTRHFLKDDDITAQEQAEIIDRAIAMKADRFAEKPFAGPQTVAVILIRLQLEPGCHLPLV